MNFIDKSEFPQELFRLSNPPQRLFCEGDKALLYAPKVAIVGSRKASVYTKNCVANLAKQLSNFGICVVSGGAIGVDIAAHISSMPKTIGVFASGLDIIYPKSNEATIRQIYKNALGISEYEEQTRPLKHHFLQRNRIVVALSKALVVAQADINSGSLQSARIAKELGIPIFVLAQRYGESDGTNALLANKEATLIDDIYKFALSFSDADTKKPEQKDEILEFCKSGVSLELALAKFKEKIYEYELEGKLEISNLQVKSIV